MKSIGNAGVVCLRSGISRATLRKWWIRFQEKGIDGLKSESRRPMSSPMKKVFPADEQLIDELRKRKLRHRRIQNELNRSHSISLSTATINKVLLKLGSQHLKQKRNYRKHTIRYIRPVPADRVRMDVCKIAAGLYQYTATDDYSHYEVLRLYSRSTAKNTIDFFWRCRGRNAIRNTKNPNRLRERVFCYRVSTKII